MIETGASLSDSDFRRIAALHAESLPESIPARLGTPYLVRFYRFVAGSMSEWLFLERSDGVIASVCVLSLAPRSAFRRTLLGTLPACVAAAAAACVTSPGFRRFLAAWLHEQLRGAPEGPDVPELTHAFTVAERRGENFGGRLISRVDAFLRTRGVPGYCVKTSDDSENRALSFYIDHGFELCGQRREGGQTFAVLAKRLDARRAAE